MKSIAFFETTKSEEQFLRKRMGKNFSVQFYPDPIQDIPLSKFVKAEVISVFIYSLMKKDLIRSLKNLKLIATRSTGFNHIDIHAARKRGIAVFRGEERHRRARFAAVRRASASTASSMRPTAWSSSAIECSTL